MCLRVFRLFASCSGEAAKRGRRQRTHFEGVRKSQSSTAPQRVSPCPCHSYSGLSLVLTGLPRTSGDTVTFPPHGSAGRARGHFSAAVAALHSTCRGGVSLVLWLTALGRLHAGGVVRLDSRDTSQVVALSELHFQSCTFRVALSELHFQSCTSRVALPGLHFQGCTSRVALPG